MTTRAVSAVFGQVIREARVAKGISQDTLAELCGFDRTYPSIVERALRLPTIPTLLRICTALQISLTDLVRTAEQRLRQVKHE